MEEMAQLFSADGWYNVPFPPPPLTYDPAIVGDLWTNTWTMMQHTSLAQDGGLRQNAVKNFGRLYALIGPRYQVRSPWECWYRWTVRWCDSNPLGWDEGSGC
ncbi:uncharacterized protein B0H18DRAFT_1039152 [Fomitopsis serialis]|uniref:uncharacterized protein n=1 Tax=Fomitopsis serialis TaxID=139415 RepID=UPI002008580B|nr:uncharacterized protein B0H18DRAFT_1039152 [Neoantrodia serialis]KAH9916073.1 hypothetical protein B0H18DRAFT_1039152 [Neoantrodia serialis]